MYINLPTKDPPPSLPSLSLSLSLSLSVFPVFHFFYPSLIGCTKTSLIRYEDIPVGCPVRIKLTRKVIPVFA